jgi:HEAT repeat protein
LKVLLSDPDPGLRAAAVSAVLGWKDPEFDHLLGGMESRESSPEVLSALKKALHPDPGEKSDEEK